MSGIIKCFTRGLSDQDIQTCATAFYVVATEETHLHVTPVTDEMLARVVQDVLAELGDKSTQHGDGKQPSDPGFRVVLINSQDKGPIMQVVKAFRASLPNPKEIIFATITETALAWTFEYYFKHLGQEHEYMKTQHPANDPDMKPL